MALRAGMSPRAFRALPAADQVEIHVHFQEEDLRKAHLEHVREQVREEEAERRKKNKG